MAKIPLCIRAPILYDLYNEKFITVYQVLINNGQLGFRRWLPPILFDLWLQIPNEVYSYNFDNIADEVSWKWSKSGKFSTKTVYNHLAGDDFGSNYKHIWKAKLPYKIKIFCWLVEKGAVLTKDNLVKRKWTGDPTCSFYQEPETIKHLFFQCSIANVIWREVSLYLEQIISPQISLTKYDGCLSGSQEVLRYTLSA